MEKGIKFKDVCRTYYISSIMPRIDKVLKERGISHLKLCRDLDMSYTTFKTHLNKKNPNMMLLPEFLLLLDYLDMSLDEFMKIKI